jgi:hypothetical protein
VNSSVVGQQVVQPADRGAGRHRQRVVGRLQREAAGEVDEVAGVLDAANSTWTTKPSGRADDDLGDRADDQESRWSAPAGPRAMRVISATDSASASAPFTGPGCSWS